MEQHDDRARTTGFDRTLQSTDELAAHYRAANRGVLDKETDHLDDGCRDFIAASTFVLVGTSDREGRQDVSPRGGPPGFVKVLDERRLVIPDLNGNNRLDSLRNIIEQPHVGLLFIIPGLGETLRLNGRACVTIDERVLSVFDGEFRRPASAIGVEIEHAYVHCAKSFRRGGLWTPDTWPEVDGRPSAGQILVDHSGVGDRLTGPQLEDMLEEGYAADLAADLPG
ncbi:MAG: pyridoxamine 5'-phosphate oxidase family protein [Acidimicrobiia bacterium]|nr:pyridoxamine 5'-phosphate oxidase family protein [Acidimicrobiia bacterium]